jgi:hypothetical protein
MKHELIVRNAITTASGVLALTLAACAPYGPASFAGAGGDVGSVTDRRGGQVAERRMQGPVRWGTDADLLVRPGRR